MFKNIQKTSGRHFTVPPGGIGKNIWDKLNTIREMGFPQVSIMSGQTEVMRAQLKTVQQQQSADTPSKGSTRTKRVYKTHGHSLIFIPCPIYNNDYCRYISKSVNSFLE